MYNEGSIFGTEESMDSGSASLRKLSESFHLDEIQTSHLTLPQQQQKQLHCSDLATAPTSCDKVHEQGTSSREEMEQQEKEFIDEFGFVVDEETKNMELFYIQSMDGNRTVCREIKWANMASDWDRVNSKWYGKLKERCRKGIPTRFRSTAWQLLLGSRKQMLDPANKGTYESLRSKELPDAELTQIIARDLSRTYPTHILFRDEGGVGQTFLRNVLNAYACVDPEVGYVQGMGFVVGALSTQMSEEETFWALHALMSDNRYKLRELYRPGFPMLQQLFYQLKRLMAKLLPKLHLHFETSGVDPSLYASQWFLTLFAYHFSFRALLRIWDIFMCEGWKIVFRVVLALMKWEEQRLLELPFDEVLPALKSLHDGKQPDEILRRAQSIRFKTAEMVAYADEYWRTLNIY